MSHRRLMLKPYQPQTKGLGKFRVDDCDFGKMMPDDAGLVFAIVRISCSLFERPDCAVRRKDPCQTSKGKEAMPASTDTIDRVEVFCLHIPYRSEVRYASTRDTHGVFALLRLTTKDGAVGIAEGVARPDQNHGEDVKTVAYQIENYFRPMLMGADPLAIDAIFGKMARIKKCRAAKALIDNALWDLKGKLLGEPVWRLLGGSTPKPVPISGIVFGYTSVAEMAKDAAKAVAEQGLRGFKIKTWKRSMEDVDVVREFARQSAPRSFSMPMPTASIRRARRAPSFRISPITASA